MKSVYSFACAIVVLFASKAVVAQTKDQISEKDTATIRQSARTTVSDFIRLADDLANPDNDVDTKKQLLNYALTGEHRLFADPESVFIDEDYSPKQTSASGTPVHAVDYLNSVMQFYRSVKSKETDIPVPTSFRITDYSCIKIKGGIKELFVYYTQQFTGKNIIDSTTPFSEVRRVADIIVVADGRKYKTYINSVGFFDRTKSIDNSGCLQVTSIFSADTTKTILKSDAYYAYLIKKGKNAIRENKYVDAYRFLEEASTVSAFKAQAEDLLSELRNTMQSNGIENQNEKLSTYLVAKGNELATAFKYDEALNCYQYAIVLTPNKKNIYNLKSVVSEQLDQQNKILSLYELGNYDAARILCESAIKDNGNNPYLYVYLANCYAKLPGNDAKAEKNYNKAIKLDPTNPDIYNAEGKYYEQKLPHDYDHAYEAFANAVTYTPDADNPEQAVLKSEIPYCKGLAAFNSGSYRDALDSFKSAILISPNFPDALCYLGICYYKSKSHDYNTGITYVKQAIDSATKLHDPNISIGNYYYWLGNMYSAGSEKGYSELATENYKTAVAIDPQNGDWNLVLAKRLIMRGDADSNYLQAIGYLKNCIVSEDSLLTRQEAYKDLGDAYYYLGNSKGDPSFYVDANLNYSKVYSGNLTDSVYWISQGFVDLQVAHLDDARQCFEKMPGNPKAMLGMGEVLYKKDPDSKDQEAYLDYFRKAFSAGLSHDFIKHDAIIALMTKDSKEFRKLRKKYRY